MKRACKYFNRLRSELLVNITSKDRLHLRAFLDKVVQHIGLRHDLRMQREIELCPQNRMS